MVWARGMLYKSVEQTVLLYGSESWVVMGEMLNLLDGFHHRTACWITGMTDRHMKDGEWEYPPVAGTMEAAGIWPIKEYIQRR